jgi:hypothetical protein
MIDELSLPGVLEIFAIEFLPTNILMRDDFPTFDLPIKAYSGLSISGHSLGWALLLTNST